MDSEMRMGICTSDDLGSETSNKAQTHTQYKSRVASDHTIRYIFAAIL